MDELTKKYFDRNPASRDLYYAKKLDDLDRAVKMVVFLERAVKTGGEMDLAVVVDRMALPMFIDLNTGAGKELLRYLTEWAAGVRNYTQGHIEEMQLTWPLIVDRRRSPDTGNPETDQPRG